MQCGVFLVLLGLSAAFAIDRANHQRLQYYRHGIRDSALTWSQSYLSDRHQPVAICNITSEFQQLLCCIPQGSCFGPFLFFAVFSAEDFKLYLSIKCSIYRLVATLRNATFP